jgi:hypothetical protein
LLLRCTLSVHVSASYSRILWTRASQIHFFGRAGGGGVAIFLLHKTQFNASVTPDLALILVSISEIVVLYFEKWILNI